MSGLHSPVCPCCAPRRGSALGGLVEAVAELLFGAVLAVGVVAFRFASGRVMWRAAGPLDAGWLRPAPEVPPEYEWMVAGQRMPRSRWARRPGWHRQLVRLAAVLLIAGAVLAPVLTGAALAGAAIATGAVALRSRLPLAPEQAWPALPNATARPDLDGWCDPRQVYAPPPPPVQAVAYRLDQWQDGR